MPGAGSEYIRAHQERNRGLCFLCNRLVDCWLIGRLTGDFDMPSGTLTDLLNKHEVHYRLPQPRFLTIALF